MTEPDAVPPALGQAEGDSIVKANLARYRELALELGASDAVILRAGDVVVDERVRLKCLVPRCLRAGETPPSKPRHSRQRSNRSNQGSTISRKPPIDPANDYTPEEAKVLRERMRQHKKKRQEERAKAERRAE